ncbi:MAG: [FeFe] hydrogenase H-cluster maturation GTPase HydF [Thermotogae bacterium]|jgi:[FeFe] hydrogenase H-cluster maturation GTPase HydF|nr:[FeFe] hydrogenase H-cluster maturation GTPase HydF [Thermotogota bacterium]
MKTPESYRTHVIFAGRRNAGKSSLFNAFVGSKIAIVSDQPGTTTDPVYKSMELLPIGPVTLIDTAGLDDEDQIGQLRVSKTLSTLYKADIVCVVIEANGDWSDYEEKLIVDLENRDVPFLIVLSKSDLGINASLIKFIQSKNYPYKVVCANDEQSIDDLRKAVGAVAQKPYEPPLIKDLVDGGDFVVLVVPIDLEAPKGRLITPQVEAIRECLDAETIPIVTKERELRWTLDGLKSKPKIVVTDSQAVMKVMADVPDDIPLTTFSILEARHKGDIAELVNGLRIIRHLEDGDNVLISEACSHRTLADDIARVKIPRWLENFTGKHLNFEVHSGREYPENLQKYKLILHCGGCVITRRMMIERIRQAKTLGIPIVNYGVIISYLHGAIPRVLEPFPEAKMAWDDVNAQRV